MENKFDWESLKFLIQELQMPWDMAVQKVEDYPVATKLEIENVKKEIANGRESEKLKNKSKKCC